METPKRNTIFQAALFGKGNAQSGSPPTVKNSSPFFSSQSNLNKKGRTGSMTLSKIRSTSKFCTPLLALFLAACGQSSSESTGVRDAQFIVSNGLNRGSPDACFVTGYSLKEARQNYFDQCDDTPRDCDHINGVWTCSSEQIGDYAPPQNTSTTTTFNPADYSCTASGPNLAVARQNYYKSCALPLIDCDQINGMWHCASERIGANSPANPVTSLDPEIQNDQISTEDHVSKLIELINASSGGVGLNYFQLPDSNDFNRIPQDPLNTITESKVALGKLLYHDTSFALEGVSDSEPGWSCASCHHAAAGFKAGIPQGIGEGGVGFGNDGTERVLDAGFDGSAASDATNKPDIQPVASPTILNSAYQSVMLWNGQFGNSVGDINSSVDANRLTTAGTPKAENNRNLSGLETQAVAGTGVHRLKFSGNTPLQTNHKYQSLWNAAYPEGSSDVLEDAAKAIAAYERTVLANKAPFQHFLRGDHSAMSDPELKGAILFFGKAGCVDCHRGPALSSTVGADSEKIFFAVGFDDFDVNDNRIHGEVDQATKEGRGGFTGNDHEKFQFKIPQLYNLSDAPVLGHGASFSSVSEVITYKNAGQAQNPAARTNLDSRFVPLGLSNEEMHNLEAFIVDALRDPDLQRYQPDSVPGTGCIIVDDLCM